MAMIMTKVITYLVLALMILLCCVHGEASSAETGIGGSDNGKSAAVQLLEYFHHRKMLLDMGDFSKEKANLVVPEHGGASTSSNSSSNGSAGSVDDWELRRAPAGPDPLHHNGNSPKNPRSAP